jgi:predicted nucleic acid-binding Zn ribbon protein
VELWSFIRARGTKTSGRTGLMEGNCPNCGAAIAMNQGAKCEYCQAVLRSGQYDWVLAEITQADEWRPRSTPPPGALQMQGNDPGFNLQDLEDTASVIFWRKAAAERLGKVDPMKKVASSAWCDSFARNFEAQPGAPRPIFCDCAVSAVDTIGVILGDSEHQALVEVCWMGRPFEVRDGDVLRDLRGEWTVRRSLMVLGRNAGVQSAPADCISSAHCPNCGGAVMADTSNACEFCNTVLNDGAHRWVLRDIFPSSSDAARALRAKAIGESNRSPGAFRATGSPTSLGGTAMLAWMASSAVADGVLSDDSIRDTLYSMGANNGLTKERVDALIRSANAGQVDIPQPANATQARTWLLDIAIAAHLTGGLSNAEAKLINAIGDRHGLAAADIAYVLKCARRDAFKIATGELRTANQAGPQNTQAP